MTIPARTLAVPDQPARALHRRARQMLARLGMSEQGLAFIEFGLVLPLFLLLCFGGLELANYALSRMAVSKIAVNLADSASRLGEGNPLAGKQINEAMLNDVLEGAIAQGASQDFQNRSRIILSSLQVNAQGGQWIAWQRCIGGKTGYQSTLGREGDGASGTAFGGMGSGTTQIRAAQGYAVMVAQIQYQYKPVIGFWSALSDANILSYTSAFPVRENRDLTRVYPAAGEVSRTCS